MTLSCGLIAGLAVALGAPPAARAHDERPPHHNPFPAHATAVMHAFQRDIQPAQRLATVGHAPCVGGLAADFYPCNNVDLAAFMPLADIGGDRANSAANDIWGWTDPDTGKEYAIVGRVFGTSFVDISIPTAPVYLGDLVTHGAFGSSWRDIKVYNNHAFIVSEANGHGMQVFDLTQLRGVESPPVAFSETAHYNGMRSAHNIVINEDSGFAYIVGVSGKKSCSGGLHMVDISDPLNPSFAGCYSGDGYTHDAQCVIYQGADPDHVGKEICFNGNEDTLTIVDVTNKANPMLISSTGYAGSGYTHQGWLTPDHGSFVLDDELDELDFGHNTRTRFWDLSDLDDPSVDHYFVGETAAIDHNLYTRGDCAFEANYRAGLRILDISTAADLSPDINEVAFFDIYPSSNAAAFNGAWSNYPYFPSGTVVVSGIEQGLFVLTPNLVLPDGVDCSPPAAPEPPAVVEAHVGDLDGASTLSTRGSSWIAEVTITIYDATEGLVENALVTGTWNVKGQNSGSCVTVAVGTCTVAKDKIKASTASVTFTVDNVQPDSGSYNSGLNHDGTSIEVVAP